MERFYNVIGTQATPPPEIEVNIDTVYIRSNIRKILRESRSQSNREVWCYDEIQYSLNEYLTFINELEKRQNTTEFLVERMKTPTEIYEENKNKNELTLDNLKTLRIQKLKEECTNSIYSGFTSPSTNYSFGFNELDQANFTQQMLVIVASPNSYTDSIKWKTLEGDIVLLEATQFIVIAQEAEQYKRAKLNKYWDLESQILLADTLEKVDSVLW